MEPLVLIDGAVPRSGRERVGRMLDYAESLVEEREDPTGLEEPLLSMIALVRADVRLVLDDDAIDWNLVEDTVIEVINGLLPDGWCVNPFEHDPGDVFIGRIVDGEDAP